MPFLKRRTPEVTDPYDLDRPLFRVSSSSDDVFTIRDACEGIQIWGGI